MDFLFPDTLKSANPNEFGIVKEIEVTGSRVVDEIDDLHKISDFILSPSGCNANNDALGQDWYVTRKKAKYRLTSWREGEDKYHTWVKLSDMPSGYKIESIEGTYDIKDLKDKINQIINILRGTDGGEIESIEGKYYMKDLKDKINQIINILNGNQ